MKIRRFFVNIYYRSLYLSERLWRSTSNVIDKVNRMQKENDQLSFQIKKNNSLQ